MKRNSCLLLCGMACILVSAGCPEQKKTQTKVVFRSDRDGNDEMYIMNVDGGNLLNLTNDAVSDDGVAVAPDKSFLVYNAAPSWQDSAIMRTNPDGGGASTLVNSGGGYNWDFAFTSDGSYLVFVTEGQPGANLRSVRADGSVLANLTNEPSGVFNMAVRPNGFQVAYATAAGGSYDIFTVGVNGGAPVNITNSPGVDTVPVYSPDGSKIAFETTRTGDREVFLMNADGANPVNLSNNPAADDSLPQFSPDGSKVLYATPNGNTQRIFTVVNLDGSGRTHLTDQASNWVLHAAWSPDSRKIVFGAGDDIWVVSPEGTGAANLTNSPGHDRNPVWTPDGAKILFSSDRDGNLEIYIMNPDGSGQTNLSNSPGMDLVQTVFEVQE